MPQYQFVGEILLPYARETQNERKLSTLQRERYIIDRLMWFDGDTLSDDPDRCTLNGARVRVYREHRKETAQPRTVARELSMAARAVRYMQAEHDIDCPNPFAGRAMTKRDRAALEPRQWRDFTPAEEARVFLAADPVMRDIILFALATGFRLSEILRLTWDRVLPDRVIFTPETQKNGRHGVRMLNATALACITKQTERGPYVFGDSRGKPYSRGVIGSRWVRVREKARIGGVTFHDLRRIAGQRMLEATGDLVAVQHQLGHADYRVTQETYTQAPVERMRAAVKAVDKVR